MQGSHLGTRSAARYGHIPHSHISYKMVDKAILTEKQKATIVYQETTKPKKPKRRDKSDLGPDFVAPDGGWGWVVCLAAGFSNVSDYQQTIHLSIY